MNTFKLADDSRAHAPASAWRNVVLWLCGAILGMAAYQLPSGIGPGAGNPLAWGLSLICAIVALPIRVTVDLTYSFWSYFYYGHWAMAAVAACLYHGTVAVVLGRIYRRKPSDALVIGGAIFALLLVIYPLWQAVG